MNTKKIFAALLLVAVAMLTHVALANASFSHNYDPDTSSLRENESKWLASADEDSLAPGQRPFFSAENQFTVFNGGRNQNTSGWTGSFMNTWTTGLHRETSGDLISIIISWNNLFTNFEHAPTEYTYSANWFESFSLSAIILNSYIVFDDFSLLSCNIWFRPFDDHTPGTNPVPIPAAFWIFVSGLLGITGLKHNYLLNQ